LSTPEPDAKTGVHHPADEYGIDAGNGSFGAAVVDAARHDHVPEDIREELPQYGTGAKSRRHEPRRATAPTARDGDRAVAADTARRSARRRMDDPLEGSPEGRNRFFEAVDRRGVGVDGTIVAGDDVRGGARRAALAEWADRHDRSPMTLPTAVIRSRAARPRRERGESTGCVPHPLALNSGGRYRIVGNLFADQSRSIRSLQDDAEIDLAADSINRYTGDLEAAGLVAIDRDTTGNNQITLTETGKLAKDCLTPDYSRTAAGTGDA